MTACPRAGCTGTIDEDGFCDTCGLEAPAGTTPAPTPAPAGASGGRRVHPQHPDHRQRADRQRLLDDVVDGAVTTSSRRGSTRSSIRGLLGAGLVEIPRVPYRDPKTAVLADPKVPEDKRFCSNCGTKVGRGHDGTPGRAGGLLHELRPPLLVHAQALPRRGPARPVRGARLPRARRPRLDLPRAGPRGRRPVGGAQGPAGHRRRGRDGRGGGREALPRRGRAPEHRQDPQLRAAPRRRDEHRRSATS